MKVTLSTYLAIIVVYLVSQCKLSAYLIALKARVYNIMRFSGIIRNWIPPKKVDVIIMLDMYTCINYVYSSKDKPCIITRIMCIMRHNLLVFSLITYLNILFRWKISTDATDDESSINKMKG